MIGSLEFPTLWGVVPRFGLLLLLLGAGGALADTITNVPVADTTLFETAPDNNLGAGSLAAGATRGGLRSRALLRFDLTGIPANAVVNLAELRLNVVRSPSGSVSSVFDLRRVLRAWGEGTGSGNNGRQARSGESSWHARLAPDTLWDTPGGMTGTDFSATVSASQEIGGDAAAVFASAPELVGDVQAWVVNSATNFGWILVSESEANPLTALRFGSREDPANAPVLVVVFSLSPTIQAPVLSIPRRTGDQIEFDFSAAANRGYTVEFTTSMSPIAWNTLITVPATNAATRATVIDALGSAKRCYRVRTP
jgi:hypothetical protein